MAAWSMAFLVMNPGSRTPVTLPVERPSTEDERAAIFRSAGRSGIPATVVAGIGMLLSIAILRSIPIDPVPCDLLPVLTLLGLILAVMSVRIRKTAASVAAGGMVREVSGVATHTSVPRSNDGLTTMVDLGSARFFVGGSGAKRLPPGRRVTVTYVGGRPGSPTAFGRNAGIVGIDGTVLSHSISARVEYPPGPHP